MFRGPLLFWAGNLAAICLASADSAPTSEAQPTTLSTTTTLTLGISTTKAPDSTFSIRTGSGLLSKL